MTTAAVPMRIPFGTPLSGRGEGPREPLVWDSSRVINGHIVLIGASGTGKTYRLRQIIGEAQRQNPRARFHVLDVHGDITIPGASEVNFSESAGYGLNPLKISADPDFGGVRKRIRTFITTMNRTSRRLGTKQEAVIQALLFDLYANRGFIQDRPETWREGPGRVNPTMENLRRFSDAKLRQMLIGAGSKAVLSLERLNKKFLALDRANLRAKGAEDVELSGLKQECKDLYTAYIDSIETGREIDDIIKYNSREVIQSVHERISTLDTAGIFKPIPPPFNPNATVRTYGLKALNADEQRMFVDVLLEELFFEARQSGVKSGPETFIVIDEAHKFVSEDEDHVINLIAKEARKFGLGLILASQSLEHFPDDIIANAATKMILGIDEMFHDRASRKIRVDAKRFAALIPQKTALVQIKVTGDLGNRFQEVRLT